MIDWKLVEDVLGAGNRVEVKARGTSMFPAISPGEKLTLRPIEKKTIETNRCYLTRTKGVYRIHRAVAIDGTFGTKGDNLNQYDPTPEEWLAILEGTEATAASRVKRLFIHAVYALQNLPNSFWTLFTVLIAVRLIATLTVMPHYFESFGGEPARFFRRFVEPGWFERAQYSANTWAYIYSLYALKSVKLPLYWLGFLMSIPLSAGIAYFISSFRTVLERRAHIFLAAFLLLSPSLAAFSMSLTKEVLFLPGLFLFFGAVVRRNALPAIAGLLLMAIFRPWLAVFAAASSLFLLEKKMRNPLMVIGALALTFTVWNFDLWKADRVLIILDYFSHAWNRGGSALTVPSFDSWKNVILFWPQGAFTALFRPLPGDVPHLWGLIAGVESILLFIGCAFAIWTVNFKNALAKMSLVYIALWTSLYAFLSPQNLGSAVRFRTAVIPLLALLTALGVSRFRKNGKDDLSVAEKIPRNAL